MQQKDSKADLINIKGYKIIHQYLWPYASIYAFKDENNDLENNNSNNNSGNDAKIVSETIIIIIVLNIGNNNYNLIKIL